MKRQLETYTFVYQLEWENDPRKETFTWRLGYRAAFSLAWRMLNRRHGYGIQWMEC